MAQPDDQEREDKKNIREEDYGIHYKPDIDYETEGIPDYKYVRPESIVSGVVRKDIDNKSNLRNTHAKIDFLLEKCEKKLSKYKGFSDFKEAIIKKVYCQLPLTEDEKHKVNDFKRKLNTLEIMTDKEQDSTGIDEKIANYKPQQAEQAVQKAQNEIDEQLNEYGIDF